MIYGSSRIQQISVSSIPGANIGPTGNRGNTGPTGITGPIGNTGSTGPTGFGISGATAIGLTLTFIGQTLSFTFGNFKGDSGISSGNETYKITSNTLNNSKLSASIVTSDLFSHEELVKVKGITIGGAFPFANVSGIFVGISSDAQRIYLYGATVADSGFPIGNTGELLFINDDLTFVTTPIKAGAARNTKWVPSENQLIVDQKSFREPIFNNKNWNAIGTSPFNYNTPINYFLGYTGNTFGTSVIENKTTPRFISNGAGDFTFEDPGLLGSGVALQQTIALGLTLGGTMEKITFISSSGISYNNTYRPQNLKRTNIGSCCYCRQDSTERICLDYVSKDFCESVSGSFNISACIDRISGSDCYSEGACCIYNTETQRVDCVNTSAERCAQFGGSFNESKYCASVWVNGQIFECPSNVCNVGPAQIGRCCVSGRCYNLSRADCNSIAGAVFVGGGLCVSEDGDPECCSLTYNVFGACCRDGTCTDFVPPAQCTDGIFQGPGTTCREVTCCGYTFSEDYFKGACAQACKSYDNQLYSCLPPGTKIGGGYFVGFVGMPNPCNSFLEPLLAFGEPLECLCNPRGSIPGYPQWRLKSCKGISGEDNTGSIYYFARTWPNTLPKNALDSRCMLKAGVPFVQQAYELDGFRWPNERFFIGGFGYNPNKAFSYSLVNSVLAVEYMSTENNLYKYLSGQVYGTGDIQVIWALIVAPEDVEIGTSPDGTTGQNRLLSWGMQQGCHIADSTGKPIVGKLVLEEIPTYPVDGLLTTRIHDGSSRNNPSLWFRGTTDLNAFRRFSFGNGNAWNSNISESTITTNINAFQEAYSEMWARNNPLYSALYQITNINESGLYGYSDWYIPSITELNYIYANLEELNAGLAVNGAQVLAGKEYWSSTSVSRLISWNQNFPFSKNEYVLENIDSQLEPYLSTNRLQGGSEYGLSPDAAYKFRMAVSNGQKMLTQVFDDNNANQIGMLRSRFRSSRVAQLRPVRRIPLVVTCNNFYYTNNMLNNYWSAGSTGCSSCLDHIEGMCRE